jgi:cardiolipin synthase A/B
MSASKRNKSIEMYTSPNKVKLIRGGADYFDCLLLMINSAKDSIHLQTYIYNNDTTGRLVADSLKTASARGVKVYVLVDGYASKSIRRPFIADLESADIHFRFFDPLFKSTYFYFGRRLHHKVVVTDARYALVGGVNIADRYNDINDIPAWLDFAIYIEGRAVQELCVLCWKSWNNYPAHMGLTPCEQQQIDFAIDPSESSKVSMRRNDWVRRKNEISTTYVSMIRQAQSHIIILCSYFLPGRAIRKQLAYASAKGVKITIVTAGISDIMLSKYAERYLYDWLLRNNIELYEYQPTILHGKIAVCDSEWLTIGSYNVNNISAYASIELNINVKDPRFTKHVEETIRQIIKSDCIHITREFHRRKRNILKQLVNWTSFTAIRISLYLFTFYFKHRS